MEWFDTECDDADINSDNSTDNGKTRLLMQEMIQLVVHRLMMLVFIKGLWKC